MRLPGDRTIWDIMPILMVILFAVAAILLFIGGFWLIKEILTE